MTWQRTWHSFVVGGTLLAGVALHGEGAAWQSAATVQASSPIYAIPLEDGNAAIVWWDPVSDPAHPGWRCEVPPPRGGDAGRTIIALRASVGDWRAALVEARAILKGRGVDGE